MSNTLDLSADALGADSGSNWALAPANPSPDMATLVAPESGTDATPGPASHKLTGSDLPSAGPNKRKGKGKAPATQLPNIGNFQSEQDRAEFAGLDKKADKIISALANAGRVFRGVEAKMTPQFEGVNNKLDGFENKLDSFAEEMELLKHVVGALSVSAGVGGVHAAEEVSATSSSSSIVVGTQHENHHNNHNNHNHNSNFNMDVNMSDLNNHNHDNGHNDGLSSSSGHGAAAIDRQKFEQEILKEVDELLSHTVAGIFSWCREEMSRRINDAAISVSVACTSGSGSGSGSNQTRTQREEAQLAMISRLQRNLEAYSTQHQELMKKYQSSVSINASQLQANNSLQSSNQMIVQLRNSLAAQDNIISAQKDHINELVQIIQRHAATELEAEKEIEMLRDERTNMKLEMQNNNAEMEILKKEVQSLKADLQTVKAVLNKPLLLQ